MSSGWRLRRLGGTGRLSHQATTGETSHAARKGDATGSALVYSTFYGGSEYDEGDAIAVDAGGNAYVTGDTSSRNLVTTSGALQTTNGGGTDSFVLRLNPTGSSLGYASYVGAGGSDFPLSIAVDTANNIYVAGETSSLTPALSKSNSFAKSALLYFINSIAMSLYRLR